MFSKKVDSTALVPYRSPVSMLEAAADYWYKRSLAITKFAAKHLAPFGTETEFEPHVIALTEDEALKLLKARGRRLQHILPDLTGPFAVGHQDLILYDKNKCVGIEIYAPTKKKTGKKLHMPIFSGHCMECGLSKEQMRTLYTHSFDQLEIESDKKFPILIFSHGLGMASSMEYRHLLEELASHGYIILGLNHTASSALPPLGQKPQEELPVNEIALLQAEDIRLVLKKLQKGSLNKMLRDHSETDRIIIAGHSLGGAAAVLVSRDDDPRIAGCINLDGQFQDEEDLKTKGLDKPVLTLTSGTIFESEDSRFKEQQRIFNEWQTFHENSPHSRKRVIDGVEHMEFSIHPFLTWLLGEARLDAGLKTHAITSQEMLQFMHSVFN